MEKYVKRDKIFYVAIEILLLFSIILSLVVYFKSNKRLNDKKSNYNQLINEYLEKEKIAISLDEEIDKINNEIAYYKDIDKEIKENQTKYFKIIKQLEDDILDGKSDKKIAYLTFDDGPYLSTYDVLDILDRYNVKATFFTTEVNGKRYYEETNTYSYDLYNEYIKRGHTLANHTYTHGIFKGLYDSVDSFMDAVIKQEEHIKNLTNGYITNIIRFPGGSATAGSLKYPIIEKLKERGYGWVDWTAHDGDGGNLRSTNDAWGTLKKSIDNNIEVILFHDYCTITINMLPDIIEYLQGKGYILLPLFYESNMINK